MRKEEKNLPMTPAQFLEKRLPVWRALADKPRAGRRRHVDDATAVFHQWQKRIENALHAQCVDVHHAGHVARTETDTRVIDEAVKRTEIGPERGEQLSDLVLACDVRHIGLDEGRTGGSAFFGRRQQYVFIQVYERELRPLPCKPLRHRSPETAPSTRDRHGLSR